MLCGSHIKIWNLANHMKKCNKEHQTLSFQLFTNRFSILMFFVSFFKWFARFLNSNQWIAKHLAQDSSSKLTLLQRQYCVIYMDFLGYSIIFHIYEQNVKKSLMIEAKNCEGGIWIVWNSIILFSLPSNNRCDMIKI